MALEELIVKIELKGAKPTLDEIKMAVAKEQEFEFDGIPLKAARKIDRLYELVGKGQQDPELWVGSMFSPRKERETPQEVVYTLAVAGFYNRPQEALLLILGKFPPQEGTWQRTFSGKALYYKHLELYGKRLITSCDADAKLGLE